MPRLQRRRLAESDTYEIPPGHDAWVVGIETYHRVRVAG